VVVTSSVADMVSVLVATDSVLAVIVSILRAMIPMPSTA
jgi:hypothetical protein